MSDELQDRHQDDSINHSVLADEKHDPLVSTADDDGFGDLGAANDTKGSDNDNDNDNDNSDFGDFGDFGTADGFGNTNAHTGGGGFGDDNDGFGDFGEVQSAGDGNGDDDFGDFNDFAGGDAFQDSGDFGDFEGAADNDAFGAAPEPAASEVPAPASTEEAPIETAPDFNAVNSRQVETYVLEKLSALYPIDDDLADDTSSPQLLNPDLDNIDAASVLSDQDLWTSLCEQSFQGGGDNNSPTRSAASAAPQFQWKYSNLRKEYYASLGLAVAKEQQTMAAPTSIPNSLTSPSSAKSKISSPMIISTESIPERKPLDIEATHAFCQFTKENLGGYSGDEMKDIIAQLTELTRHASDELTYWLDQREQMIMDSERYNEMIASLVGRAAKLKDAESKQNTKTKRLTRTSFHLK
ncbi:hypothetical protein BGZ54_005426 [Gamsiella multidivaricata]|nr:hypothetical protein BGZ54_005426 [Gamsiella multidivaricata]